MELNVKVQSFSYSKVYVLESLGDSDRKTGTELYNDSIKTLAFRHSYGHALVSIESKEGFLNCLDCIKENAIRNNELPLLHIEMHGLDDKSGLALKNGDFIKWQELKPILTEINTACQNNLFISLAACNGFFLLELVSITDRSPFWGLLSATHPVYPSDIAHRFKDFYDEILDSGNLLLGLRRFHSADTGYKYLYSICTSEHLFKRVYSKYLDTQLTDESLERRFRSSIFEHPQKWYFLDDIRDLDRKRRDFKRKVLSTTDDFHDKYRANFFMADLYKENEKYLDKTIPPL